jgi:hypothetical protein
MRRMGGIASCVLACYIFYIIRRQTNNGISVSENLAESYVFYPSGNCGRAVDELTSKIV